LPADRGSWSIFRHQRLLQCGGGNIGEVRGTLAQLQEEIGHRFRLAQVMPVEIILPAIGDDAPPAHKAAKLELTEWKRRQPADERAFGGTRHDIFRVAKPGRKLGSRFEQAQLARGHVST
jgi:hypothetical protein